MESPPACYFLKGGDNRERVYENGRFVRPHRIRSERHISGRETVNARWLAVVVPIVLSMPVAAAEPDEPAFTEVTEEVGLSGVPVFRIAVADVDGDGYEDILIHTQPDPASGDVLDKQFLFRNVPGPVPGDPHSRAFEDITASSGIRADRGGTGLGRHSDAGIFADVDNDGDLDLFTNVYVHDTWTIDEGRNEILLNDGTGVFTLAPEWPFDDAPSPIYNTASEVFVDYDKDGNIDLFIGNWYCGDLAPSWCVDDPLQSRHMTEDQLYKGEGDGHFVNRTAAAGLGGKVTSVYAVAAFDWNNDGWMDLFAPTYSRTALLADSPHWRNNGDGTFTQVQATTGYDDHRGPGASIVSFGSYPRDYDNDGTDEFIEAIVHGTGDYQDGTQGLHTTVVENGTVTPQVFDWNFTLVNDRWTEDPKLEDHRDHQLAWIDYDNDGSADFVLGEGYSGTDHTYLFKHQSDHRLLPETAGSGLDVLNTEGARPGNVIPVDYDRDGDEDLLVGTSGGMRVFRNDVGTLNNWISLTLEGVGGPGYSNRSAIGARVEVTAGATTWTRHVLAGHGHQGPQRPLRLIFGLGSTPVIDSIHVVWPSTPPSTSTLTNVAVNQLLTIREPCDYATDPANLMVRKDATDLTLEWDDPAVAGTRWNVYRDGSPDPSGWGAPHEEGVTDAEPGTPGIQYRDPGAVPGTSAFHYLITAVNECGETDLR